MHPLVSPAKINSQKKLFSKKTQSWYIQQIHFDLKAQSKLGRPYMSDHLGQIMRQFYRKSFQNCSSFIALLSLMAFCIPPHLSTHLMFNKKYKRSMECTNKKYWNNRCRLSTIGNAGSSVNGFWNKSLVLRYNAISVLGESEWWKLGLHNFVWSGKNAFRVCFSVYQILFWKEESAFRVVEYKMSLHCLLQRLVDQVLCNLKI